LSYQKIKWLILLIPTLTIGLWEYVRHQFLLPFISMELGNWLAPVIVFSVTMLFITKLFAILEHIQEELQHSRAMQAVLQEREKLARELHDGIAQSLFLVSVQVEQWEQAQTGNADDRIRRIRQTVREMNEYVRHAIDNLRYPPEPMTLPWMESLQRLVEEFSRDTSVEVDFEWTLPEEHLSMKEKVGLYASVREALQNIRKHANARHVWIRAEKTETGWRCAVADDGQGYRGDPFQKENRYGLKIMKERAAELGWILKVSRDSDRTLVEIRKEEGHV